jgi:hypothetical protein
MHLRPLDGTIPAVPMYVAQDTYRDSEVGQEHLWDWKLVKLCCLASSIESLGARVEC